MRKLYFIILGLVALMLLAVFLRLGQVDTETRTASLSSSKFWQVQSVDTMKFSRDLAREKEGDENFDEVIDEQVALIAESGATHVAVGTPYDEEFIPFLTRWVEAARHHGLKVWFRGNFAGWEGWFSYEPISRKEHIEKTENFILENGELFEDGDIFTACPECENGGPGDPRRTGDIKGHREFLIEEYEVADKAFRKIDKDVVSNFSSMNGDVASLIMDEETTEKLGGVVVVDHYVRAPEQLSEDLESFQERSGGQVVLGEFGAPIPDIHGNLSEKEQARWLSRALLGLLKVEKLSGINYWVGFGGTTGLWNSDGTPKEAAGVLAKYYKPKVANGLVVNELGRSIAGAEVSMGPRSVSTKKDGSFSVPYVEDGGELLVRAEGYGDLTYQPKKSGEILILKKENENLLFKVVKNLYSILKRLNLY